LALDAGAGTSGNHFEPVREQYEAALARVGHDRVLLATLLPRRAQ
jgi:hypothetical protein